MDITAIIVSFLIGEGVRATTNGKYVVAFQKLDEIFEIEPGTSKSFSYKILEGLYDSDMVSDVTIQEEEINILFYLKYCPNVGR